LRSDGVLRGATPARDRGADGAGSGPKRGAENGGRTRRETRGRGDRHRNRRRTGVDMDAEGDDVRRYARGPAEVFGGAGDSGIGVLPGLFAAGIAGVANRAAGGAEVRVAKRT